MNTLYSNDSIIILGHPYPSLSVKHTSPQFLHHPKLSLPFPLHLTSKRSLYYIILTSLSFLHKPKSSLLFFLHLNTNLYQRSTSPLFLHNPRSSLPFLLHLTQISIFLTHPQHSSIILSHPYYSLFI